MNVLKPHVSLNISNIDASVAFYEKAFGVRAAKRRPGYAKFDLASPALNLTMQEAPRTGVNASHFGIQVASTDDVLEAKRAFEAAELKTFTEENTACCYAVQDKVWIEDPDGNSWEVFVVKGDADVMGSQPAKSEPAKSEPAKSEAACCAPGCCAPAKLGDAAR
ncbi:ArsI/CadI family heavy metal resistance metalloenzyme [Sorangium sp. So ce281]|uniref:ArsI/CadI family heavy metal resistance metalloenzyme n=1 Tax=unclassified Sorangium TaxID=2621164 RepID=UPI003F5D8FFE